jgi:hypothetical protein
MTGAELTSCAYDHVIATELHGWLPRSVLLSHHDGTATQLVKPPLRRG